ncbi:MAG: Nif3-like dinuclear metal center hexameric protein [Mariniphaga sp.]
MRTKLTFILFLLMPLLVFSQSQAPKTPADAVELIKRNVTCSWTSPTVDTFKAGNPESKLDGIAVCMFADMETLRQAANKGCNFIITHEPVFYNHSDETESYSDNPVFKEKMQFIKDNGLVIFRFHDHIHKTQPDGISVGMIDKLGLEKHAVNGSLTHFQIPQNTLAKFAKELKERLDMQSIRIIGNPDMQFTKVAFMAGAPGGQHHIKMLNDDEVEVLIAGEANEWETYLYANDAVALNKDKAVIFLGHIRSEEAGMEYCAQWLKVFINDVPVHFIENKANFLTF